MVIVWPPVSAIAGSDGRAPAVRSAYLTQGANMAPANIPGSAGVRWDGVAWFAARILKSEFIYSVFSWLSVFHLGYNGLFIVKKPLEIN